MTQPVEVGRTAELSVSRLAAVRALLLDAFDGEFTEEDWQHTIGGWHVIVGDEQPLAHAAVVPRVLEVGAAALRTGYVEAVATAPARQREGLGARAMREVDRLLRSEFELGALSTSEHGFYERSGWERWRGPTFVRHGDTRRRTADEDDGIMVLRFGATLSLDLGQPICCERREGDDW
jgi:aminoglycoside 2'-N-acetyltransferase I